MRPVGLGNNRISTAYAQISPRTPFEKCRDIWAEIANILCMWWKSSLEHNIFINHSRYWVVHLNSARSPYWNPVVLDSNLLHVHFCHPVALTPIQLRSFEIIATTEPLRMSEIEHPRISRRHWSGHWWLVRIFTCGACSHWNLSHTIGCSLLHIDLCHPASLTPIQLHSFEIFATTEPLRMF
jgi:hypothetical protein